MKKMLAEINTTNREVKAGLFNFSHTKFTRLLANKKKEL